MPNKVISTAYHEAGHAVMAFELHQRFPYVTIDPDDNSFGHPRFPLSRWRNFQPDWDTSSRVIHRLDADIMCSLAGCAAEAKYVGRHDWVEPHDDWMQAHALAHHLCRSDEETRAYLKWLWIRTRNAIDVGFVWLAVQNLAKELVTRKTIGYRNARKIIYRSVDEDMRLSKQSGKRKTRTWRRKWPLHI